LSDLGYVNIGLILAAIIEGRRVFKTIAISVIFEMCREDYKTQSRDDMIPLKQRLYQ